MVLKEHIKLQLNNCSRLSLEKKVTMVKRNLVTVVIVLQILVVFPTNTKGYFQNLYFKTEKRLRRLIIPIIPF